jgi:hypothetical protein
VSGEEKPKETPKEEKPPEWPAHFPPGCPPTTARDVNEKVYRFHLGNGEDHKSATERGSYIRGEEHLRCGLSSYVDLRKLKQVRSLHRKWAAASIVAADLRPDHGKILQDSNALKGHHTLWLRRVHLLAYGTLFQVVSP